MTHCALVVSYIFLYLLSQTSFAETKIQYVEETEELSSFETLVNLDESLWKEKDIENFNLGFLDTPYWFKVKIPSCAQGDNLKYLAIEYPLLDTIDLWLIGNGIKEYKTGDLRRFEERPVPFKNFFFPVPCGFKTALFRIETTSSMQIPLSFVGPDYLTHSAFNAEVFQMMYFGAVLMIALYNLLVFSTTRRINYILYVGFILSYASFQATLSGMGLKYLWGNYPALNNYLIDYSLNFVIIFAALFTSFFLQSKRYTPKSYKVLMTIVVILCIYMPFSLTIPYQVRIKITIVAIITSVSIGFFSAILVILKRHREGIIYGFAWGTFLIGAIILSLNKVGAIPRNQFTENIIQVASVLEMALLSFALADQLNTLGRKLKIANSKLEDTVTKIENIVKEKTGDIKALLDNIPQGVFTISDDLRINTDFSRELESIIGTPNLANQRIDDVFLKKCNLSQEQLDYIIFVLEFSINEDQMNFDSNSHFLPKNLTYTDGTEVKNIEIEWNTICLDDQVSKIIIVLRDTTEIEHLKNKTFEQKQKITVIEQILDMNDKFLPYLKIALNDINVVENLVTSTKTSDSKTIEEIFRRLHVLKGLSRNRGAHLVSSMIHDVETKFESLRKFDSFNLDKKDLLDSINPMKIMINRYQEVYESIFRNFAQSQSRGFSSLEMQRIEDIVLHSRDSLEKKYSELTQILLSINTVSIVNFTREIIEKIAFSVSPTLGKPVPKIIVDIPDIMVNSTQQKDLESILNLLTINALDHGLEPPEIRSKKRKPTIGLIQVSGELDVNVIKLQFRDDGAGIDMEKIKKIMRAKYGNSNIDDGLAADEIFKAGFSTKKQITINSGRGVGLDAVSDILKNRGGEIKINFIGQDTNAPRRAFEFQILYPLDIAQALPKSS